jgi:hypothetical protein
MDRVQAEPHAVATQSRTRNTQPLSAATRADRTTATLTATAGQPWWPTRAGGHAISVAMLMRQERLRLKRGSSVHPNPSATQKRTTATAPTSFDRAWLSEPSPPREPRRGPRCPELETMRSGWGADPSARQSAVSPPRVKADAASAVATRALTRSGPAYGSSYEARRGSIGSPRSMLVGGPPSDDPRDNRAVRLDPSRTSADGRTA